MGIFLKTFKRHSASACIPKQAFQLITPMRWGLRAGKVLGCIRFLDIED